MVLLSNKQQKRIHMKKQLEDAPLYINGWLILVAIRLGGGVFIDVRSYAFKFSSLAHTITGIMLLLFIFYALVVLTLFLKRHKAFKSAYICLEAFSIVSNLSAFLLSFNIETISRDAFPLIYTIALLVISTLWIIYMLSSERVKKTFVFNWNEKYDKRLVEKANGL